MTTMTSTTSSATFVTNDITPMIINNTICYSVYIEVNQTLQESIEKRRTKFTINKPKLFSNTRKLYSVFDYQMSSKMISNVAVVILVVAGILIILADISLVLSLYSKESKKNKKKNLLIEPL